MAIVNDPEAAEEARSLGASVGDESTLDESLIPSDPPQIGVKPGWQTSQGQLTGVFVVAAIAIAGFLGYNLTAEKAQNWVELGVKGLGLIGALVAGWRQLQTYTNSRGMNYSNAAWATASMQNPFVKNDNFQGGSPAAAMGFDLGGIFGGQGNKDPQTYINIAKIVGAIAGGKTGKTIDKVTGGLGQPTGSGGVSQELFHQFQLDVQHGFETIVRGIADIQSAQEAQNRDVKGLDTRLQALEHRQDPTKLNPQASTTQPAPVSDRQSNR